MLCEEYCYMENVSWFQRMSVQCFRSVALVNPPLLPSTGAPYVTEHIVYLHSNPSQSHCLTSWLCSLLVSCCHRARADKDRRQADAGEDRRM